MIHEFTTIEPKRGKRLYGLFADSIGIKKPSYHHITSTNIDRMRKHLTSVLNTGTARIYFVMFKRIVSLIEINCPNLKEGWRSNHRKNPPLGSPKEAVYLTVEEIQRLASLEGLDERREAVRNQFLVGCLTGARYSDFIVLKKENIFGGYLTYISQKTKIRSKVPVSPLLEKLIIGCSGLTCDIPLMSFERDIKELCRIAQIQTVVQVCDESGVRLSPKFELVTSHTARRSFCRNLAMYNTPIMTIRDLAGHTNIAMTERYIGRNIELIPGKTMMDYFESFS